MSPLEDALQEQQTLQNKGYSVEQIQCAALQIIAGYLQIMFTPTIKVKETENADD